MKYLFTEVHQFYLCTKKFPKYLNAVVFKYYCITEFMYVHQACTSLARTGTIFQNKLTISVFFRGSFILSPSNNTFNTVITQDKFHF